MENNDNDDAGLRAKRKKEFLLEIFREAKQMEEAMKKAPWEVCQWGSIEFGWKDEFFYLN